MSTTLNDTFWLERITQCRSSGLTDRQWCIENGIPVSTFYYHVRALSPSICLQMQGIRVEIHEHAGADVIRNTLLALHQLC